MSFRTRIVDGQTGLPSRTHFDYMHVQYSLSLNPRHSENATDSGDLAANKTTTNQ